MKFRFDHFASFSAFNQDVLREIIRDGEIEMRARLDTANAADQRALTLVGFQLTIAVAMTSAAYALVSSKNPDFELGFLAAFVVVGMIFSAHQGLSSASPSPFCFPGNDPKNWHSEDWNFELRSAKHATLKKALIEQCYTLHTGIHDNKKSMEQAVAKTKLSIGSMFATIYLATITSVIVLVLRSV